MESADKLVSTGLDENLLRLYKGRKAFTIDEVCSILSGIAMDEFAGRASTDQQHKMYHHYYLSISDAVKNGALRNKLIDNRRMDFLSEIPAYSISKWCANVIKLSNLPRNII